MRRQLDRRDRVVFAPHVLHEMSCGFNQLATLLAGTLGPARGPIWHANGDRVDRLSSSGTIVRRIVELPDRLQNTGAMQVRHMVWRMQERYGDGGATAAVVARSMLGRANRYLAAGADPRLVHDGMRLALPHVETALEGQRLPSTSASIERLIAASLSDPDIATVFAEMVDVLGRDPAIQLEVMNQPYLDRSYIPGGYWKLQPSSSAAPLRAAHDLTLDNPLVLVADDEVLDAGDLLRAFEVVARENRRRPLVIVGAKVTGAAQEFISLNVARGTIEAFVVSPLVTGAGRHQVLQDIAVATGSELVSAVAGFPPGAVDGSWLGSARQMILKRDSLVVMDGQGDPTRIQQRKSAIRKQIDSSTDDQSSALLRDRLASLAEGVGLLQIGGITRAERDDKRRQVERILRILPVLLAGGQVPGGGMAYLACRPALERFRASQAPTDVRLGLDVVLAGLEAPFLQLVVNGGGLEPTVALQRATTADYGQAFDASSGLMVSMESLPVNDSQAVLCGGLHLAISAVGELITTGVAVLPRESQRQVRTDP